MVMKDAFRCLRLQLIQYKSATQRCLTGVTSARNIILFSNLSRKVKGHEEFVMAFYFTFQ